jgi:hypothetical protein
MHSHPTPSAPAAGVDLDVLRRRFCVHEDAIDPDPIAVSWPRDPICLNCGETVNPLRYDIDPQDPRRRRLRCEDEAA